MQAAPRSSAKKLAADIAGARTLERARRGGCCREERKAACTRHGEPARAGPRPHARRGCCGGRRLCFCGELARHESLECYSVDIMMPGKIDFFIIHICDPILPLRRFCTWSGLADRSLSRCRAVTGTGHMLGRGPRGVRPTVRPSVPRSGGEYLMTIETKSRPNRGTHGTPGVHGQARPVPLPRRLRALLSLRLDLSAVALP